MEPVIVAGADGHQRTVRHRDGWWIVEDTKTREVLSGGFKRRVEAIAEAVRLAEWNHAN